MIQTVKQRLHKANEYVKEAEIIYSEKISNLPVLANLYHAMMNCLFAVYEIKDIGNRTHADIIGRFKKEFVEAGIVEKRFTDAIDFAFKITHECDCDRIKPPGDEEIKKLFPVVREFVQTITKYLIRKYDES